MGATTLQSKIQQLRLVYREMDSEFFEILSKILIVREWIATDKCGFNNICYYPIDEAIAEKELILQLKFNRLFNILSDLNNDIADLRGILDGLLDSGLCRYDICASLSDKLEEMEHIKLSIEYRSQLLMLKLEDGDEEETDPDDCNDFLAEARAVYPLPKPDDTYLGSAYLCFLDVIREKDYIVKQEVSWLLRLAASFKTELRKAWRYRRAEAPVSLQPLAVPSGEPLRIYDLSGRLVLEQATSSQGLATALATAARHLPNGVYFYVAGGRVHGRPQELVYVIFCSLADPLPPISPHTARVT